MEISFFFLAEEIIWFSLWLFGAEFSCKSYKRCWKSNLVYILLCLSLAEKSFYLFLYYIKRQKLLKTQTFSLWLPGNRFGNKEMVRTGAFELSLLLWIQLVQFLWKHSSTKTWKLLHKTQTSGWMASDDMAIPRHLFISWLEISIELQFQKKFSIKLAMDDYSR